MAYLIKQNGIIEQVSSLDLEKMQRLVGGYIQIVNGTKNNTAFICDEEGKLKNKPINVQATRFAIAAGAIFADDILVGDVIMADGNEKY